MNETAEETIDLSQFFGMVRRRLKVVLITTALLTLISTFITLFILKPQYSTSTMLLVVPATNEQGNITQGDVQTNLQLINTYKVVMLSPVIIEEVIDKLDLDISASALASKMKISTQQNSQAMTLSIQHENPDRAAEIVNTTAKIFRRDLPAIMNVDNITILSLATVPTSPASPNLFMNVAIGFIGGSLVGIALVLLLEFMDKTIKRDDELEKLLEMPVLGMITHYNEKDLKGT